MKFSIDFSAQKNFDEKYFSVFEKYISMILKQLRFKSAALSVMLVRDKKMAALNWKLMRHRGTTDVLSFSYLEKKGKVRLTPRILYAEPPVFLGEVILCLDIAKRNAKEYKTSFEYECVLYLCHGILHCLGYEDRSPKGFREMQALQNKILRKIFLSPVSCLPSPVSS